MTLEQFAKMNIPKKIDGVIDIYWDKRKNDHSNHECHEGICNNVHCWCCGCKP